ncbi:MAG: hypothetical protein JST69_09110 [Bacteroidetes bacterium]|nr:hypothetical protein [Bacteroidota bacterium]
MIFVFKTSVKNKIQAKMLKPHIDKKLPSAQWNFDLQDCDKILRIVNDEDVVTTVIALLQNHNFHCEELE